MSRLPDHPLALPGETTWEHIDEDKVFLQRDCPDCDGGLLYMPVRLCGRCHGDGYLTRVASITFDQWADMLHEETAWLSSTHAVMEHPIYQRLRAYGPSALPMAINRLRNHPTHWLFPLLHEWSEIDPATGIDTIQGAADAWIAWYDSQAGGS